jgi:hypothetical protein
MAIFTKRFAAVILFYFFLALLTTSVSFFSRKIDIREATNLQTKIWREYTDYEAKEAETPGYTFEKANLTRVFYPALMTALDKIPGISPEQAFSLLRIGFVFLFYLIFHFYIREWGDEKNAFLGTLFVGATIPLTFNNWFELPTEFPEMIFFTLGIWSIYKGKFWALVLITFFATLNRETAAFLPLLYLFVVFDLKSFKKNPAKAAKTFFAVFIVGLAWLIPYVSLRFLSGLGTEWNHQDSILHNTTGLAAFFQNFNPFNYFLFYLYLFGIIWIIPFLHWRKLSFFWRRILLTTPIILFIFLFAGGFLSEPRELVPLYPILVPPALAYVFNEGI